MSELKKGLKEGNVKLWLCDSSLNKLGSTPTQNGRWGTSNTKPNLHFLITYTINIEYKRIFSLYDMNQALGLLFLIWYLLFFTAGKKYVAWKVAELCNFSIQQNF